MDEAAKFGQFGTDPPQQPLDLPRVADVCGADVDNTAAPLLDLFDLPPGFGAGLPAAGKHQVASPVLGQPSGGLQAQST